MLALQGTSHRASQVAQRQKTQGLGTLASRGISLIIWFSLLLVPGMKSDINKYRFPIQELATSGYRDAALAMKNGYIAPILP